MEGARECCLAFFSSALVSFLFLFSSLQVYVLGSVAMSSNNLWPAGSILATLASPFGPAMGARLVNWARHRRLVGPIVRWLFPADQGTHPDQQGAAPQVGPNADTIAETRDALRDTVREGLREVDGRVRDLTAEVRNQTTLLQQLVNDLGQTLEEVRGLRTDTHTATVNIARHG